MLYSDFLQQTGKFKVYRLDLMIDDLARCDKSKPSARIISTKRGRRAIAGLIDIENNHNHSWYTELVQRLGKDNMSLALFYRGNKISVQEMFEKADSLSKYFVTCGIVAGDEIPCCISNTPELVYTMLAANKIGAKLNLFGTHLNKEYLSTILDGCTDKLLLITDDNYKAIKEVIKDRNYSNRLAFSLADSLPANPELTDEYVSELDSYYHYDNFVPSIKREDPRFVSINEAIEIGNNSNVLVNDFGNLDTEFLVTYTSGSTINGFPKQIVHSNRSLITMGRFHDPDLSGNPKIPGLRGLAHIHTESNTDVITCISDNLMQGWSVALEPEYSKDKALDYIYLNKPNYLNMTTSFLIQAAKDYLINKKFHSDGRGKKFPFLFATFAVGENTSKGEEKFINRFLKEAKAGSGVKLHGFSLPYAPLSIGGGDCEHGGLYYSLWKSFFERVYSPFLKKREYGMVPVPFAHVSVFKPTENGMYEECNYDEIGIIAANSATTMVRYKNDLDAMKKMIIVDTCGREWLSSSVYGYVDKLGTIHVKGRVGSEIEIGNDLYAPFVIEDIVSADTKNVLSCVVTAVKDEDHVTIPIINLEFQPGKKMNFYNTITSIKERLAAELSPELSEMFVFRVFETDESFPLKGSGKRDVTAITDLGLTGTFRVSNNKLEKVQSVTNTKIKNKTI